MKTYKQRNQELERQLARVQERFNALAKENYLRKQVIEDNKLFDPVEYSKIFNKFATLVDAIQAIKLLSFDVSREEKQSHAYRIASEVLEQIKDK